MNGDLTLSGPLPPGRTVTVSGAPPFQVASTVTFPRARSPVTEPFFQVEGRAGRTWTTSC